MSGVGDSSRVSGFALPIAGNISTPAANPAVSLGAGITAGQTSATSSPFSLGGGDPGAAVKASQPSTIFSLGGSKLSLTTTTATTTLSSTITPTSTTSTTSAPSFGVGSSLTFSLPTATTSAPSFGTGLSFTQSAATTTSTPAFSVGSTLSLPQTASSTTITSTPSLAATTGLTSLGTTTTVTSSSVASTSSLNFFQLEEAINKWHRELEEQEKSFLHQALQVNAWDRLLIANSDKIMSLNDSVEHVKLEQQQLDHELDFILAQQRELEDLLTPLEKELETNGVSDPERESTYKLAEDLDIQLKQMSEDLKEIVEHINETNRTQDNTDPIVQIGRILNAHMNSLQWIDQNTSLIASHLEQVSKLQEVYRRESERPFLLPYD